MKKIVAFILAVMLVGSFAGCSMSAQKDTHAVNNGGIVNKDMNMYAALYDIEAVYEAGSSNEFNTEEYNVIKESGFISTLTSPLSTFAIDVDTGSYGNFRRMVRNKEDIPSGAIRTEEMLNYFDYTVKNVSDGKFSVQYELHECPWNKENGLIFMTIQANPVEVVNNGNNFVFLIDTSGSMGWDSEEKIELAINGFKLLAKQLSEKDVVSIVTYAGSADTLLDGCKGNDYETIERVLNSISTDGGTNGSGGINAAYECAVKHFIKGGNNRVIIASDGDMNLGITSQSGLVDLIKEKKELGIFLTTLGFGSGNYSDANMEQIADAGNGNYFYIDNIDEAQRVLVDKMMQNTVTIAKDVKLQVEFNPVIVDKYRLIGYENRAMSADDFNDDTKDGGEVGAGQQVTVMYEITFANGDNKKSPLKYQDVVLSGNTDEMFTLSIRYKEVNEDVSKLEEYSIKVGESEQYSNDFYFASSIAELSAILRESDYAGTSTIDSAIVLAQKGSADDKYRNEYIELLKSLKGQLS